MEREASVRDGRANNTNATVYRLLLVWSPAAERPPRMPRSETHIEVHLAGTHEFRSALDATKEVRLASILDNASGACL